MTGKANEEQFCKKHPKEKMSHGDCHRCGGNGFTDGDLEDTDDPTTWHNSGNCYSCKGSGLGFLECEICEEDYRTQQEMEEYA